MKNKNQKVELFDIHTHILPNVDDGSQSIDDSLRMIKEEVENGVKSIILTPHYRTGMFEETNENIDIAFNDLKNKVKEANIEVDLYLGREIYISSSNGSLDRTIDRINNNITKGLNDSKYYLFEFSYTKEIEISEITYSLVNKGHKPIIAHIERYAYVDSIEKVNEIRNTNALIQVNASSVVGLDGVKIKKLVWNLLKNDLVDIVSSDIHGNRINCLRKAYDLISKKLGSEKANNLFYNNPLKIIK